MLSVLTTKKGPTSLLDFGVSFPFPFHICMPFCWCFLCFFSRFRIFIHIRKSWGLCSLFWKSRNYGRLKSDSSWPGLPSRVWWHHRILPLSWRWYTPDLVTDKCTNRGMLVRFLSTWHKFRHIWDKEYQFRKCLLQIACKMVCGIFSWLIILNLYGWHHHCRWIFYSF